MRIPNFHYNTDTQWRFVDGYLYRENVNVGIDTTTPIEKLTVEGRVAIGYGDAPDSTSLYGKLYVNSAGELHFISPEAGDVNISAPSSSVNELADLDDVSDSDTPVTNDVMIFNGTEWVFAPYNTTFSFSVASFTDSQSSTILIGSGVWKAIGALSYTASYSNGPATGGYVSHSGWTGNLTLTSTFQGPTVSTEAVNYPGSPGSLSFVLHAAKGAESATSTLTRNFYNYRFWGVTTTASGYTESNIEAFDSSELSNSRAKTFTVTADAGEYIVYAYPSRLGAATFAVGGFSGGFGSPETVSVANSAGYTENYFVYRSTNSGLGATSVVVS